MKKRFVTRKKIKFTLLKIIICLVIGYFACFLTIKFLFKKTISINDEKKVNEYLAIASNNLIGNISIIDLINMNLASPETFLKLSLTNFKKLDYKEIRVTPSIKVNSTISEPLIYIYNTHQTEDYNPGSLRDYNITPTVYMASVMLQKALENKGIKAIVEEANIKMILNANNWSYSESYLASRQLLDEVKKSHPSVKYFIDIHRDSVSGSTKISDRSYAKIMFVVGMKHDQYKENEELTLKLHNYLKSNYESVTKNIFYGKNSRYNQDFDPGTILVEVGGPNNTIDEVNNSIYLLAEALESMVGDV